MPIQKAPIQAPVCRCNCRTRPANNKAFPICQSGRVGTNDPKGLLCDLCYFEATNVNQVRRAPTCGYRPGEGEMSCRSRLSRGGLEKGRWC